jgi:hypothetical protein
MNIFDDSRAGLLPPGRILRWADDHKVAWHHITQGRAECLLASRARDDAKASWHPQYPLQILGRG